MLQQPQSQSRWTALVERWDARLERFKQSFDPSSEAPERRMKPWAVVALSIGLAALAGLIGFGLWWIIDHHKWALIVPLLKMLKLFGIGVAIVTAVLFQGRLAKYPLFQRFRSRDAGSAKE